MSYYFTADCHFNHTNIIEYCNRPFSNVEQMNQEIIKNWRDTVSPDDTVFHLGDFCFANKEITETIINVLTGHIIFLKGNHEGYPKSIIDYIVIKHKGHSIYLNHYPEKSSPLMLSLCGHVHDKWLVRYHDIIPIYKNENTKSKGFPIVNVGVDMWDFKPVPFEEIEKISKY